jgi:primosomal protein N' (replication factor Y)
MLCHICGFSSVAPPACPECGNPDITFRSIGTKYLVDELQRLFPKARIQRFDTDLAKTERLEQHYENIRLGNVDILVGTQMLSKGLDLPKLSVIGVITADTALLIPDYTANEITYQQLTQIIGRVGRGHRSGKVIIQTYQPGNPAIQAAVKRDYGTFYTREIKEREAYGFPPFTYLLRLECARASRETAERTARSLATELRDKNKAVEVVGPSPSFHEKVSGKYRWQLVIKAKRRPLLVDIIQNLPANWSYDIDPVNLL